MKLGAAIAATLALAISWPTGAPARERSIPELLAQTVTRSCITAGGSPERMIERAGALGWVRFQDIDPAVFGGTIHPDFAQRTAGDIGGSVVSMTVIRSVVDKPPTPPVDLVQCILVVQNPGQQAVLEAELAKALGTPNFPSDHAWIGRAQGENVFTPLNTSFLGADPRLPSNVEVLTATIQAPDTLAFIKVREVPDATAIFALVYRRRS